MVLITHEMCFVWIGIFFGTGSISIVKLSLSSSLSLLELKLLDDFCRVSLKGDSFEAAEEPAGGPGGDDCSLG